MFQTWIVSNVVKRTQYVGSLLHLELVRTDFSYKWQKPQSGWLKQKQEIIDSQNGKKSTGIALGIGHIQLLCRYQQLSVSSFLALPFPVGLFPGKLTPSSGRNNPQLL